MSTWELVVIIVCGVAGFSPVSFIIDAFRPKTQAAHGPPEDTNDKTSRTSHKPEQIPMWFEVLGVQPTAPIEEIKMAYHQRARQYHPDRVQGLGQEFREIADRKMKELNLAYQCGLRTKLKPELEGMSS
jgi:hypothetical protein